MIRILIVEDNLERDRILRGWMPPGVRAVVARSAGAALGILKRDGSTAYAGIMLDYDLQDRCATDSDQHLSGQHVANALIQQCSRDIPILVHSMNVTHCSAMVRQLQASGFWVTRIPMAQLTSDALGAWIQEVQDNWSGLQS